MGIVGLALGFVISGGWSGRFPVSARAGRWQGEELSVGVRRVRQGAAEVKPAAACSNPALLVSLHTLPPQVHRNLGLAATILGLVQASRALCMLCWWCGCRAWQRAGCCHRCPASFPSPSSRPIAPPASPSPPCVQLPALRWRPKLTSPYRRLFNIL